MEMSAEYHCEQGGKKNTKKVVSQNKLGKHVKSTNNLWCQTANHSLQNRHILLPPRDAAENARKVDAFTFTKPTKLSGKLKKILLTFFAFFNYLVYGPPFLGTDFALSFLYSTPFSALNPASQKFIGIFLFS